MDQQADSLHQRVADIRAKLDAAALERWGRAPQIVAISKNVDAAAVNEVLKEGLVRLGENRVQEVLAKKPHLDAAFQIDLIGRLQSNKVKYIIDQVGMIQSLDRESLAQEIDRRAQQRHIRMPVLIQVNIGQEAQKGGVDPKDVFAFARYASALSGLQVKGLMAVMPDIDRKRNSGLTSSACARCLRRSETKRLMAQRLRNCPWACPAIMSWRRRKARRSCGSALRSLERAAVRFK